MHHLLVLLLVVGATSASLIPGILGPSSYLGLYAPPAYAAPGLRVIAAPAYLPLCAGHYDGYIANPNDATSFIQCSNGLAWLQPCAEGTSWSQGTLTCEGSEPEPTAAPAPVEEADPECANGDGLQRNPNDCNSFIQCSNGQASVQPCAYGTKWSTAANACVQPPYSDCSYKVSGYAGLAYGAPVIRGYGGAGIIRSDGALIGGPIGLGKLGLGLGGLRLGGLGPLGLGGIGYGRR